MSRFQLDEYRELAPQDGARQRLGQNRQVILLSLLLAGVGLALGFFLTRAWLVPPPPQLIELSHPEQDDYILMVAEAYATDRNVLLAQQRLARLNDPRTTERIIALAQEYAPQNDYVAQRLAFLAVAAGSKDKTLMALAATVAAPTPTPTSTRTPTQTLTPTVTRTRAPTLTLAPNYVVVTGVPTLTPTPSVTPPPSWTPTPVVSTQEERPEVIVPMPSVLVAQRIPVNVPAYANFPSAEIRLAARPRNCTPADRMPAVVNQNTLLCPGQTYAPFALRGNNLTLYGDRDRTAVVQGAPRSYAITVEGTNVSLVGVHVRGATAASDLNQWLCLYPRCPFTPEIGGALGYGGGILLQNTSNAAVLDSQFDGGTAGIVVNHGYSNKLVNNRFADLNGWGILLMQTRAEYVVSNQFVGINRACNGLDNIFHDAGCESSGLAMTQVRNTLVYNNTCRRVSNCYYANGDGGYGSANIKFYNNRCAGAKNNCFEATFGLGHEFDYNTAAHDAEYAEDCNYPFWIGGSTAYFGPNNEWNCLHDFDTAVNDARSTSDRPTEALALAARPAPTRTVTPTRRIQVARPAPPNPAQPAQAQ